MVNEITPTYYAADIDVEGYTVRGQYLKQIPDDAVGIYATDNDTPGQFRHTTERDKYFDIVRRNSEELRFETPALYAHAANNYLGMIVSADRTKVYWVNETKPLP